MRYSTSALLLALSVPVAAQTPSVLDLTKEYFTGSFGIRVAPSSTITLLAASGSTSLQANGTFTRAETLFEMTMVGVNSTPLADSGTYVVSADGMVTFDDDPADPLAGERKFWIDTEGRVIHAARNRIDPNALSTIMIEKSSGQSLASLVGSYHFLAVYPEVDGNGDLIANSDVGTAVFDGSGNVALSGAALFFSANGVQTSNPLATSVPYSVAPDGELTIEGFPGAMSADGELLFSVITSATGYSGMLVAVRAAVGGAYTFSDIAGRYSLAGQWMNVGLGPNDPFTGTAHLELILTASGVATGTWAYNGSWVESAPSGVTLGIESSGNTASVVPSGAANFHDPGGDLNVKFSSNGRYLIGRYVDPDPMLYFGIRQCGRAESFGTGTPGTGGAVPTLGMKTFPTLGNSSWQLTINNAVGGALGVVAVGFQEAPGLPALGGLIWINPLTTGYTALLACGGASGTAGAGSAIAGLAIPASATLAGLELVSQALILDVAAPQDFAMSPGFRATLCR